MDAYSLAQKGEIVSTVSALAMDEDILCRKCGDISTLSDCVYQDIHPQYKSVTRHGFKCPSCNNVNLTYVKTPRLMTLEKRIANAPIQLKQNYRTKYQREFTRVQKKFGMV